MSKPNVKKIKETAVQSNGKAMQYSVRWGEWLCELMGAGNTLKELQEAFPKKVPSVYRINLFRARYPEFNQRFIAALETQVMIFGDKLLNLTKEQRTFDTAQEAKEFDMYVKNLKASVNTVIKEVFPLITQGKLQKTEKKEIKGDVAPKIVIQDYSSGKTWKKGD